MIDIQYIRDNPDRVKEFSVQKGYSVDIDELLIKDGERRELTAAVEALREERNTLTNNTNGERPSDEQIARGRDIRQKIDEVEGQLKDIDATYLDLLKSVPNMPASDVPVGSSEDENVVSKRSGEIPKFDFEPKNHWQIAESKGWIDKERAAKVTGSRFAYIKGDMVLLQFAIMQFVMAVLTNEETLQTIIDNNNIQASPTPFVPVLPPAMIKTSVYEAMDRLEPSDDRYRVGEEDDDLWLQGSAEHTLGSMYMNEILPEQSLPIRYVGFLTSFRREAGTYGKDTEGIIRMHQFDKLEMESFSTPEQGMDEHLLFVAIQEYLVQQLKLPYQVLTKCTADIGKPNARGIDIEVWFPGQDKYRETHTADYMTDYQSRRLKTRLRRDDGRVDLIHTNDATAFALGRIMAAILENYQQADGSVEVPEVLRKYMGEMS